MTLNNIFHKVRISKLALLLVCFIAQSAIALADNKLYVADVTIAPDNNGPVEVSVCLDNDVSGVTSLSMNIELPTGLEFVETNYMGQKIISATASSRANGASIIGNPKTGKTSVVCMSGINAGTGPIFTFKVKPNAKLGSLGTIKLTNAQMKTSTETYSVANNNLTVENGKVVKPSTMSVAFSETAFYMEADATHSVAVSMNKNLLTTVNGFQADVTLPAGWTATITNGIITNSGKGTRVMSTTSFSDEDGPLFTINLKAPADFGEGPVTVKLENIYVTVNFVEEVLNPIELTINPTDLKADVEAANAKVAELKAAAALAVSAEAKAYEAENVKTAVATAEAAIAAVAPAIEAVEAKIAEGKLSTENKEALAALFAAAEKAIADAQTAIAAAEKAYADQKAADEAEAAAVVAANTKVTELKAAAADLAVSAEAKAYEADNVKTAVTAAETAIAAINPAIAAVEAKIAEGKVATDNKEALATVIAAAEKAIADAKTAIAAAEKAYADQKALDDAAEAGAKASAEAKVVELKAAAEALAVSAEAKAYEAENVKAAVAAAEEAIAAVAPAIAAVEAKIAEGKVSTDNKEALATAIATAEQAVADAKAAIAAAEKAYADQKALDDAAEAGAKASAEASVTALKVSMEEVVILEAAKNYDADNVKTAVAAAEQAIANANAAIKVVEDLIAEGKLATDNKVAVAQAILAAQKAVDAADDAVEVANETYKQQRTDEEAAVDDANAKVVELKAAATALVISAEAKAYEAENVKTAVATAETAIAAVNTAIAAVEAKIAEGKLAAANKEALAAAIAAAEQAIADAQTAIATAEKAYTDQKAADDADAAEAAALTAANAKVVELKAAATALAISAEAKAYEAENVKTAVATAETAITGANTAIAAVEAKIAEGKLSTDNKETLAAAIAAAEQAIADAKTAIAAAEKAYTDQKAADDAAAALAAAKESLQAAITAAKAMSVEGRTAATVQALNDAIAAAETALAAETATVESLNTAKAAIEQAQAALAWNLLAYTGQAYIIDAETGKFVAAGHDWGTRAIVDEIGLDLTFAADAETKMVTIDTRVFNKEKHFLGSNLYMDAAAANWGLIELDFGFYITDGTKFISIDENDNLVMSEKPHLWIIVTPEGVKEARLADMAEATAEKPVDATWMIQAANFNRGDERNNAWTVSEDCTNKNLSGGNSVNNNAESWHSTFTISQTIEGVPNGIYQMTAQGFWRQDGENEAQPVFFINDQEKVFPVKEGTENSMSDASASFTDGKYTIEPIVVKVVDGTITLGVKNETNTTIWCIWDNFRLTYLGKPANEWENLIVNSDMEGESTECFYVTEQYVGGPFVAVTTAGIGKDGSKAIKIQTADDPATDWDSQFFVRLPYELPAGTKFKFSFDYKASVAGSADTQAHNEPSEYIHWSLAGSPNFTTEWQSYTYEGTVPSQCDGNKNANGDYLNNFQTIAFNLAKNKKATEFIIDNVKFEVPWDTKLVATTADNQKPYPVELAAAKSELRVAYANAKAINTTGKNGADALATAITAAETVLKNTSTATAADATAAKEALSQAVSVFNKANLDVDLVEIAQNQGKDLDDFTRATLAEGAGYNTYTANADLTVAFKMFDIDVKDCDYLVVKFAEPVPAGWSIAFWSKTGNKCVEIPAGQLEYKYEFAKDNECAIANGILPQICVLTLWGAQKPLVMKVEGIYKHKVPVVDGINSIAAERQNGVIFNMNGQKVDKARKGMYIINGKKVVIK